MSENKSEIVVAIVSVMANKKGRVMLSLRRDEENEQANMKWELPGGGIEFGETATETLIREVREEIGLIVKPLEIINCLWTNIWEVNSAKVQVLVIPFLCIVESGIVSLQDAEVVEVKWFSLDEVKSLDTLPGTYDIVNIGLQQYAKRRFYGREKTNL